MKCILIYNPNSGKGKIRKNLHYIVSKLESKFSSVEVFKTEYIGHASELAKNACGKCDVLVVGGGDGTLNEVINGLGQIENKPTIGYIPVGTVNDTGHSLNISRNIKYAVNTILKGREFKHDIFKMNEKYGIYVCCAGLFTETSYATSQVAKKKVGKAAYVFHGIKKIFSTKTVPLKLYYDGGVIEGNFALLLIINSKYVASFKINKKARLNDGAVDILLVSEKNDIVSMVGINRVLQLFLFGLKKKLFRGVLRLTLSDFKLETSEDTVINLDGEKVGAGSFDFHVIKEGVTFLVPSKAKI